MIEILDILTVANVLRLVVFVFIFGYCAYAFFLMLRVRILSQTLKSERTGFASMLARLHFFGVLIGSILISILILL